MSHIVSTLNKLDAGTMEKVILPSRDSLFHVILISSSCSPPQVQLMSRDEQSVLVLTYAELKQCLFEAFNELSFNM